MCFFIQAPDYQLRRVIIKLPHTPIIKVNGFDISKPEDWDEHDMKVIELNAKAINILYYAFDPNKFNQISTCNSARKIGIDMKWLIKVQTKSKNQR